EGDGLGGGARRRAEARAGVRALRDRSGALHGLRVRPRGGAGRHAPVRNPRHSRAVRERSAVSRAVLTKLGARAGGGHLRPPGAGRFATGSAHVWHFATLRAPRGLDDSQPGPTIEGAPEFLPRVPSV